MAALTEAEIARYQRHIVLKEIGGAGQQKLKAARIALVGLGGLIDDDNVSLSNLQRQVLFSDNVLGQDKAQAVAHALGALNPHVETHIHRQRLSAENGDALLAPYDVVIDGSDNFTTRLAVNDACFRSKKILISGAVGRFDGQVMTFKPWLSDADGTPLPCYRSFMPHAPQDEDDCASLGIVGALTGIIGSLMALEAIKEITESGTSLAGHMLIYDGLGGTMRRVKLNWDPHNPNNGTSK